MGLYDATFCNDLVYGGWDSGIINNLRDARNEIRQNLEHMDFENAKAEQEMRAIVEEMTTELNQLIGEIESIHFR